MDSPLKTLWYTEQTTITTKETRVEKKEMSVCLYLGCECPSWRHSPLHKRLTKFTTEFFLLQVTWVIYFLITKLVSNATFQGHIYCLRQGILMSTLIQQARPGQVFKTRTEACSNFLIKKNFFLMLILFKVVFPS